MSMIDPVTAWDSSENNTHFYRLRRAAIQPYTDRQAANDSLHAQPYTGYAGRYRYTTVELQYTTPAVGSRSRRTLHTHTDTLARSRFAASLNIRFPRCDIQQPLDGPTSVFSSRKACLQGSRKAPGKLQESSRKAPGKLQEASMART